MKKLVMVFAAIAMAAIGFVACPQPAGNSASSNIKTLYSGNTLAEAGSLQITVKLSGKMADEIGDNAITKVELQGDEKDSEPVVITEKFEPDYTDAAKGKFVLKSVENFCIPDADVRGSKAKILVTVSGEVWKTAKKDLTVSTSNFVLLRKAAFESKVEIVGTVDTKIAAANQKSVKITLVGDSFKDAIEANASLSGVISGNLPEGITISAKNAVKANDKEITVVFGGTPTVVTVGDDPLALNEFTIAGAKLNSGNDLVIDVKGSTAKISAATEPDTPQPAEKSAAFDSAIAITGKERVAIESKTAVINITGDTFNVAIESGANLDDYIQWSGKVENLSITAGAAVAVGDSTISVVFGGTPTTTKTEFGTITIKASCLAGEDDITVDTKGSTIHIEAEAPNPDPNPEG